MPSSWRRQESKKQRRRGVGFPGNLLICVGLSALLPPDAAGANGGDGIPASSGRCAIWRSLRGVPWVCLLWLEISRELASGLLGQFGCAVAE